MTYCPFYCLQEHGQRFYIILLKPEESNLRFPMQFVKTAGIEENMILKVKFENLPVSELIVGSEKNSAYKRYKLIGWHEFMKDNDISIGEKCDFKFVIQEGMLLVVKGR
ncbi:hypothetical protein L1987_57237 [Smallanthus sonchifolius]|uniref:Uncharacterized protein n=1 Tax=Smallanthus sonchifolius TaxID=185202 RepID=A0ACB9DD18_9ASTR|nr:hypothetical protein L1987_57237 [Smallanthus sonchifolius]